MNELEQASGPAPAVGVATGSIDDLRFIDTLVRNADPEGKRAVPIGTRIVLRGWMFAPNPPRTLPKVSAALGGRAFQLLAQRPRPDIAAHFGAPQLVDAGFHGIIALDGVPTGPHVLTVYGQTEDGARHALETSIAFEVLPSRFSFPGRLPANDGEIIVRIDSIESFSGKKKLTDGSLAVDAGDIVVVRGWAIDTTTKLAPSGVFAAIDGREYVMGVHGLPRDDVAQVFDEYPGARRSGFTVRIPTRSLVGSDHQLAVFAVAGDGETYAGIDCGKLVVRPTAIV